MKRSLDEYASIRSIKGSSPLDPDKLRKLGYPENLIPIASDKDCSGLFYYPHAAKYPFYLLDADIYFQAKDAGKKLIKLDLDQNRGPANTSVANAKTQCSAKYFLDTLSAEDLFNIGKDALDLYRSGNEDVEPRQDDLSIVERNHSWIPTLLETFQNGPSFVAVGLNHLYGDNGVLSLLAKQGYAIERM